MIRLTFLLLLGLGAMMYFADDLPQVTEPKAAPKTSEVAKLIKAIAAPPAAVAPSVIAAVRAPAGPPLVPFKTPMIVEADGTLRADTAPIPAANLLTVATAATAPASSDIRYISANRLNVREGPSTDFAVLDSVNFADAVTVIDTTADGWAHIRIEGDGVEGYVSAEFLQAQDPNG